LAAQRKSTASKRPAGLVLAGGLARRMGGEDKGLLILGKRPLLAHVLGRLAAQAGDIAISANGDPARFAEFGRPVLADTIEGHLGPLAGLLAGMIWARDIGAAEVVSVPTDAPFIPGDLIARLAKASAQKPGVPVLAGSSGRRHPVVGLWPVSLAGRLLDFLLSATNHRVSAFADANEAAVVDFPMIALPGRAIDPFLNVNTPHDLAAAQAVLMEIGR
jgi:molybdopterin-guanine dinucleotide biosynthesis protein A